MFSCRQNPSQTEIAEGIRTMVKESEYGSGLVSVYADNDFKPIWVRNGGVKKSGKDYFEELEDVLFDGLEKSNYLSEKQAGLLEKIKESKDPLVHAALDIALSNSFLELASDLNIGRVDPAAIHTGWKMARKIPTANYEKILLSVAEGESVKEGLDQLRPNNPMYTELRSLLRKRLAESTEETEPVRLFEGKIEKGDRHAEIPAIRRKLLFLEDLRTNLKGEGELYDEELFHAVKKFQKRHGLINDGVIGSDFLAAINYSPSDIVAKIKVNLERLRWLPDFIDTEKDKVIVNIPDFHLFYLQGTDTVFTSKVVVGREYRKTPVFEADMTYLVFNPTWTLPETILWKDVIPSIQKNIDYLKRNNMEVLDTQERKIDSNEIDWDELNDKEDFPYLIRQAPGKENPLGKIKFMLPNEYAIYIHDTPAQGHFSRDERALSSGCIRMEHPEKFAALLLEGVEDWDEEKIAEHMDLDEEKKVDLNKARKVWILYFTIWDQEGNLEVRQDLYGMDRKLAEALALPQSEYFL
ncbi:MAG TPA: L,D-transpeptidase family protein [Lunatimonas sp.]|nr:L,D-transpeptidase family protein [Lunatimonas sp.]